MNRKNNLLLANISFLVLVTLLFSCVVFIAVNPDKLSLNLLFMLIVFFLMVLTYFTDLTVGLIINAVLILAYLTYSLFIANSSSASFIHGPYFWLVISPLITLSTALVFRYSQDVEKENEKMKKQMGEITTFDSETGLRNRQAFLMDLKLYQSISKRYHLELLVVVCEYRYPDEMKNMLEKNQLRNLNRAIFDKISSGAFRIEDAAYIISDEPIRWGMLFLQNQQEDQLITERFQKAIGEIDFNEILGSSYSRINIRIGTAYNSENTKNPMELVDQAVKQMEEEG